MPNMPASVQFQKAFARPAGSNPTHIAGCGCQPRTASAGAARRGPAATAPTWPPPPRPYPPAPVALRTTRRTQQQGRHGQGNVHPPRDKTCGCWGQQNRRLRGKKWATKSGVTMPQAPAGAPGNMPFGPVRAH